MRARVRSSNREANDMLSGLDAESRSAEADAKQIEVLFNKVGQKGRAQLTALHLSGCSKDKIREVYDALRMLEMRRVQTCMTTDERSRMNELVRTQHEYDDDALDDAFEDIRADVLAREAAAELPEAQRLRLYAAQRTARVRLDEPRYKAMTADERKHFKFGMLAAALAPSPEQAEAMLRQVQEFRNKPEVLDWEADQLAQAQLRAFLAPAIAAVTGQRMTEDPPQIQKTELSGKAPSKLKRGFFDKAPKPKPAAVV